MSVLINARISVSDKRVSVGLTIVSILQNYESVKYRKPQNRWYRDHRWRPYFFPGQHVPVLVRSSCWKQLAWWNHWRKRRGRLLQRQRYRWYETIQERFYTIPLLTVTFETMMLIMMTLTMLIMKRKRCWYFKVALSFPKNYLSKKHS